MTVVFVVIIILVSAVPQTNCSLGYAEGYDERIKLAKRGCAVRCGKVTQHDGMSSHFPNKLNSTHFLVFSSEGTKYKAKSEFWANIRERKSFLEQIVRL